MLVGKFRDQWQPHVAGFGIAVQQHHGVALAGNEIMQLDAVDLGELALRCLRQRRADDITATMARQILIADCIRFSLFSMNR